MAKENVSLDTAPTWDEIELLGYPKLEGDVAAGVVVIGGGITGILASYLLAKEGKKVVLIEKDKIGFGATGVTTAFITESLDTRAPELLKGLGALRASLVLDSHEESILLFESIIRSEKIECEFVRTPNYIYATSKKEADTLKEYMAALKTLGRESSFVEKENNMLGFKNEGYLVIQNQAKFHPRKFIAAILERLQKMGVEIYEDTEARDIEHFSDKNASRVKTPHGNIITDWVFAATYEPFQQPLSVYFKKALYTSYVFELEMQKNALVEGIFEDIKNPYHYFRVDQCPEFDRIIVGGEDHRSDLKVNKEKNFQALEDFVAETFHGLSYKIVRGWTGPILESIDGLAYVGELHPNDRVLYAFGFSGNGITYSAIASQIITDKILGRHNAWSSLYDVKRMPDLIMLLEKGIDYSKELFGGAVKNTLKYSGKKSSRKKQ